jgi:hypothetical protein
MMIEWSRDEMMRELRPVPQFAISQDRVMDNVMRKCMWHTFMPKLGLALNQQNAFDRLSILPAHWDSSLLLAVV